eukprot:5417319-Amphidinium_carterae.1
MSPQPTSSLLRRAGGAIAAFLQNTTGDTPPKAMPKPTTPKELRGTSSQGKGGGKRNRKPSNRPDWSQPAH